MKLKITVKGHFDHVFAKNFNEEIEFEGKHTRYLAHKAIDETYESLTDKCEHEKDFYKMVERVHQAISNKQEFDEYFDLWDYEVRFIISTECDPHIVLEGDNFNE